MSGLLSTASTNMCSLYQVLILANMSAERVSITKQAPTPHRPPRPMQRQEGPHQQLKRDISSLSPHWFCQGALSSSAVVPVCVPAHTTN